MDRDKYVEVLWSNIEPGNKWGGGRVGTLQSVKGGGGVREVQSLTLLYNILTKIVAPSYTFNWKRYFFHMISY